MQDSDQNSEIVEKFGPEIAKLVDATTKQPFGRIEIPLALVQE